MAAIRLESVECQYTSSSNAVFTNLSVVIDTEWRTGIVARNGRGKTTLLRLIHRSLPPVRGRVIVPVETAFFPITPRDPRASTRGAICEAIAPFAQWEQSMEQLLGVGDESSLHEYGLLLEQYERAEGFNIEAMIRQECAAIGLRETLLEQPFGNLSGGEQTRALILALFLKRGTFPLLDEPTNHLDMKGREVLGRYLAGKRGFIVVSHDQYFLDLCVDHVLSINRSDIRILQGGFTRWRRQMELEEESEEARNEHLKREIGLLEDAARKRRAWGARKEKEKTGSYDSGFVGHKAAKMMKRAVSIERRIIRQVEEKKALLQNRETIRPIRLNVLEDGPPLVATVDRARVDLGGKTIFSNVSITVKCGDRIALLGDNGSGKTTLLRLLRGEVNLADGSCHIPGFVRIANGYQSPLWQRGFLRDHLVAVHLEESKFQTMLGALNVVGEIFDRPLETFSEGEIKKVDLCRSLATGAHLFLWDEPLNYIDYALTEQLEEAILESGPTMVFVEHDREFVRNIATEVVDFNTFGKGSGVL